MTTRKGYEGGRGKDSLPQEDDSIPGVEREEVKETSPECACLYLLDNCSLFSIDSQRLNPTRDDTSLRVTRING